MASSLAVKRCLSSPLISRSLIRPTSASAFRFMNTNTMRQYDGANNSDVDVDRRSDRYVPLNPRRSDDIFSDVLDPFFPARSLSQVLNMMDQFIPVPSGIGAGVRRGWEAKETENALLLRMDMPGLGKEDVNISMEQNTLIIKGCEGANEGDKDESPRRYTSRIDLPNKLYKIDQIKAEMKNGVLKILVPKMKEEERRDVINIKVD